MHRPLGGALAGRHLELAPQRMCHRTVRKDRPTAVRRCEVRLSCVCNDPRMAATVSRSDLAEYVDAVRRFSRNARLYMVHIVGMDMIHGTWDVLFNLYLLALFTPTHGVSIFGQHIHALEFVGLRLAVG